MSKQQEANAHGQPCEWQPLLHKWHGPAARQGQCLTPMQPTPGVRIYTETQLVWKITVQEGHEGDTCSHLFRELGPYIRENRSVTSTWRTSKWFSARPKWEGIRLQAQQSERGKVCPEHGEAKMQRLRKMREEREDKLYDEMFRSIISSLDDKETPLSSSCILRDAPSPTLEAAAGPLELHSTSRVTKAVTGGTPKHLELVSLDQLLAELGLGSDESLSCDALVKELLENWDQQELPDRQAAGHRVSEPQRALVYPQQDNEGGVLRDGSSVTPELAAGSQGPHSTSGVTKDSAGENNNEMAPPDLLTHLCPASGSDALLNELLEKWEEEELQDTAAAGERDSEAQSVLCLPVQVKGAEAAPSPQDSDPCNEEHSKALPAELPEEPKMCEVCASPKAMEKHNPAQMQAGCAQALPPQEEPWEAVEAAAACLVRAQALARSVPAGPAAMAPGPQPPAPRPWRSMARAARRALRRLFSFSCLRGQPHE